MAWSTTITVELNLRASLANADNWVDVTQYVLGKITINRGRQNELDQFAAGTCSFTLINRDRRFDFTYSSGPYFGLLLPRTIVRIKDNTTPLYYGYVQGWEQGYDYVANMATVDVSAVDFFDVLSQIVLKGGPATIYHRLLKPTTWFRTADEPDAITAADYKGKHLRFSGGAIANAEDGEPIQGDLDKVAYYDGYSYSVCNETTFNATQNWSIGGWFRVRSQADQPNDGYDLSMIDFGSSVRWRIETSSSDPNRPSRLKIIVQRFSPNLVVNLFGPVSLCDDQWHHIVVTNQANLLLLYVDGVAFYSDTGFGTAVVDSLKPLNVGGLPNSNFPPTKMWAHDIFVYNQTLTGTQVTLLYDAATNWHKQTSSLRITRLIDFTGLTVSEFIPSGDAILSDVSSFSGSLLEAMQGIAEAEGGGIYIDPDGTFRFRQRYANLLYSASTTVQATFGDDASADVRYLEATPTLDMAFLFNQISTSVEGGSTFVADDMTSQAAYGVRSLDKSSLPLAYENDAVAGAQWKLSLYSTPKARIPFVKYSARSSSTALTKARALQLQDLVTVYRTPLGVGSPWSFSGHIEGITHEIDLAALTWEVTYYITQYGVVSGYLAYGSATFHLDNGKLGW